MTAPKIPLLCSLLATCVVAAFSNPLPASAAPPAVGSIAPDFSLATADGHTIKLSDLRGKVVVVNFFATWCPPCRAETPDLVSASGAFAPRDVVFVGVDAKEPVQLVQQFAAAKGIAYPLALDSDGKIDQTYDVRAIPTTYVVGRDGRIAYSQVDQLSNAVLAGALNAVLAGHVPNESPLAKQFRLAAASAQTRVAQNVAAGKAAAKAHNSRAVLVAANLAIQIGVAANKRLDALQSADDSDSINYFAAIRERDALGLALSDAYQLHASVVRPYKATISDVEQASLLLGQKAEDEERFGDALQYYREAAQLAAQLKSKDTAPLDGVYLAAFELRDYATALRAAQTEARIAATDPESWLTLASAYNSLKQYDNALDAEHSALALAAVDYAQHPFKKKTAQKPSPAYELGRVYLKMGRSAILANKTSDALAYLAESSTLAPGTIVAQQAQEQYAALAPQPVYVAVSGADKAAAAQSQPAKLWMMVTNPAPALRVVHLAAVGVPKKWVLSFCYEKVCDPYKSDVSLGPNSSRRIELQVVPLSPTRGPWNMTVSPSGVDQMDVEVTVGSAKSSITVLAS